ncbi:MAG TPA: hypothetical protein DCZ80_06600, partial [Legionellales bacterium]|nr:hypothetical protein [Legionellales bacterium]
EKTLQKLIKREALLTRKEILILKKDLVELGKKVEKLKPLENESLAAQAPYNLAQLNHDEIERDLKDKENKLTLEKGKKKFFRFLTANPETVRILEEEVVKLTATLTQQKSSLEQLENTYNLKKASYQNADRELSSERKSKEKELETLKGKLNLASANTKQSTLTDLGDLINKHRSEIAKLSDTVISQAEHIKSDVSTVSSSLESTVPTESDSSTVSSSPVVITPEQFKESLKALLIDPKKDTLVLYPFSQKLYDLSLARLEGDDHKNAEYLIALNQIIASINPNDSKSIEEGIALLTELEKIKFENKKGLSSWRSNTSQLIDEVKSFFETRLEVVQTIKSGDLLTSENLESKIKQINAELDEQKNPDPVTNPFLAWVEEVIKSFIGWLATKKGMSFQEYNASLKLVQESLTLGALLYCAIITLLTTPSSRVNTTAQQFTHKDENAPNDTVLFGPSAGG